MATWRLKPSAGIHQLLCFSDSHFFMLKWPLFHWLSLRGCDTIPLCTFHSFYEVLAFCSHFLEFTSIHRLTSLPFWAVVKPVLFLCLPPSDMLGIYFHLTNQCRRVSSAANLLPEPIFWLHFDAFQSILPSSTCAALLEPAPAKYPPSILHTRALLPTFSKD